MVNPTWEERDLLVLRAAVEYCEDNNDYAEVHHLRGRLDLSERDIRKALNALCAETPKLFQNYWHAPGTGVIRVERPTGEARRRLGLWPTPETLADRLVQAMTQAAEQEPDEEKRGRLKTAASWFGNAGRDVLVDVTAAVINRQMGGA
ncbi:hypothetical protein [Micromonospora sp. S4605]|uniref:hypothetical protein n=1 Tax=Micromonospora sp. S4605 TaxID=1420897 RepID=UPI0011B5D621|nr:hypothetical protein [Micromonospora sp. S4605]